MPTTINSFNLKLLSHSAIQTFRSCPRKYELDRLYSTDKVDSPTVHTAFGSALGAGIQEILKTKSLDAGIWAAFQHWNIPLYETHAKAYKSFPHCVLGLMNFYQQVYPQLGDWELAYFNRVDPSTGESRLEPAIELSFCIKLPLEYYYRGFLDGVLIHKHTQKYRVLELKTTGSKFVDESNYYNSFQGVGYSVVLDRIATKGYSDYEVLYLVYKTYSQIFEDYPLLKLASHRMNWLNDLLLTVEQIEMYKRVKRFSQNGDSCKAYGSLCRFYEECNFSNESIFTGTELIHENTFDPSKFEFQFTFEELLNTQTQAL